MFGGNPTQHTTVHIFKLGGRCIMLWVCFSLARTRMFFKDKIIHNRAKHRQNPREKPGSNLGDKFTFQQDNNLKHKPKYTLELLTKKAVGGRVTVLT
jgi:hypothetical protein